MSQLDYINSYVDQAQTSSDLVSFIPHIPLIALQTFIKHHVQHSSYTLINRIYHDALPIDGILPDDLIQNILSFDHLSIAQRAVSKTFKRLSDTNDLIQMKQRNKIVHDPQYEFNIDFQSGTRWVVQPIANMHQFVMNNGDEGPLDLENALKQCQNEDILLLYDGEHSINSDLLFRYHSLSLIGMGDNVIVKVKNNDVESCVVPLQGRIYFNNVHLTLNGDDSDPDDYLYLEIDIGHLWMEQCTLSCVLFGFARGSLHLKSCCFDGQGLTQTMCDITLAPSQNTVEIIGCTFTNCGDIISLSDTDVDISAKEHAVIEISVQSPSNLTKTITEESIKIVGNIFSNNKGRSVIYTDCNRGLSAERKRSHSMLMQSNIVSIHHNIFQNKNRRVKNETPLYEKTNPNQIAIGLKLNE
eukprot:248106_1